MSTTSTHHPRDLLTAALATLLLACGGGGGGGGGEPDPAPDAGVDADVSDTPDEPDVPTSPCDAQWVTADPAAADPVEIFAFEASRPDATATSAGVDTSAACSRQGVLPWTDVSWDEAAAACASIGARLCEGSEWDDGCLGPGRATYPYGATYDPEACNVLESPDGCLTGGCTLVPTGAYAGCVSAAGAFDMSGNAAEWVATGRTFGDETYEVRGGSYQSADDATIRCRNAHFWRERDHRAPTLGFRCCR